MYNFYGRFCLIFVLPAWPAATVRAIFKIAFVDLQFRVVWHRQYGHGNRGCLNPAAFFSRRHTLPSMPACFAGEYFGNTFAFGYE
jgi:hypothetical protein